MPKERHYLLGDTSSALLYRMPTRTSQRDVSNRRKHREQCSRKGFPLIARTGRLVTRQKIQGYRSLLDFYLRVYLDTRDYLRRTKQRLAAMDKMTAIGRWPRRDEWRYIEVLERHKVELRRKMLCECRKRPEHHWIKSFPGIGILAETALLSKIDIAKANTVSSLWRFCGLGVENDGNRQRSVRGTRRNYCALLKTILIYDIGRGVLISRRARPGGRKAHFVHPGYRRSYERFKRLYARTRPRWTKPHIHNAAVRRTVKEYVKHLWARWRYELGLPIAAKGSADQSTARANK